MGDPDAMYASFRLALQQLQKHVRQIQAVEPEGEPCGSWFDPK